VPSRALTSLSLPELATDKRQDRIEPELGPLTASQPAYSAVRSDSPADVARLSGGTSEIRTEPRLFGFVPLKTQPISASGRSAPTARPHVSTVVYLLLLGLVAAAVVGISFGIAFSLLTEPKDKTVVAAGPASSGAGEAETAAKARVTPVDTPTIIVASAENAMASGSRSHEPNPLASQSPVSPTPAAADFAGPPRQPTRGANGGHQIRAHSVNRRSRSAHQHRQLAADAEKQRILSMDRAHAENYPSLTPPRAEATNPFDELITGLTGQAKPVQSLTPP
jgi:hypothetical protein